MNKSFTDESEDEEFFDCHSEPKEAKEDGENVHIRRSIWNQPEGRLRKFNNMRLIETGEFMYIPITQVSHEWMSSFFKCVTEKLIYFTFPGNDAENGRSTGRRRGCIDEAGFRLSGFRVTRENDVRFVVFGYGGV